MRPDGCVSSTCLHYELGSLTGTASPSSARGTFVETFLSFFYPRCDKCPPSKKQQITYQNVTKYRKKKRKVVVRSSGCLIHNAPEKPRRVRYAFLDMSQRHTNETTSAI